MVKHYANMAPALLAGGFEPIPVSGKKPIDKEWTSFEVDKEFVEMSASKYPEASVGLRCGELIGIDIDILDKTAADYFQTWIQENVVDSHFVRTGQAPKRLIACRIVEPITKITGTRYEQGTIEILGLGQQFVGYGIHEDTKAPYTWNKPIKKLSDLPEVSADDLEVLINHLDEYANKYEWTLIRKPKKRRGPTPSYNPDDLQVPSFELEELVEAVNALPVSVADDYHDWIEVGMAIHFETRGSRQGLDLFDKLSQKSGKYSGRREIEAKWRSFDWVAEKSKITGATIMMILQDEGVTNEQTDDFWQRTASEIIEVEPINIRSAFRDLPPAREWLLSGLIPSGQVGALTGAGGTGKSNFALLAARCVASGIKIDPFEPVGPSRVLIINVEDAKEDILRRLYAQGSVYLVSDEELNRLDQNLAIYPGRGVIKPLMKKGRFQNPTPTASARTIESWIERTSPHFVILDTRSRLFGLEENSNDDNAQWLSLIEEIAEKFQCGILIIHHVSKASGEKHDMSAARGASAFVDNCRYVLSLANLDEKLAKFYLIDEVDRWRYFSFRDTKQNYEGKSKLVYFERMDEGVPKVVNLAKHRTETIYSTIVAWFMDPENSFKYSAREVRSGSNKEAKLFVDRMKEELRISREELYKSVRELCADDRLEERENPDQKTGRKKLLVGLLSETGENGPVQNEMF